MDNNRDRLMNSLNAVKYGVHSPQAIHLCFDYIEQTLHDLYNRIEELEKRLDCENKEV